MASEDRNTGREVTRWLRVGVLSLSVLGPAINSVVARLRERADAVAQSKAITQSQEKLAGLGTAVGTTVSQRGAQLTQTLSERGDDLSYELAKRRIEIAHELGKRGDVFSHEVAKRRELLGLELSHRGEQVTKEVSKRGRAARDLAQRNSRWLLLGGFGLGAAAAGVAAFYLIRHRLEGQAIEEEEQYILSQNGQLNGFVSMQPQAVSNASTASSQAATNTSADEVLLIVEEPISEADIAEAMQESTAQKGRAVPEQAAFVGIASTRRYYPASTPLDLLKTPGEGSVDVVYFSNEDEAKAQGFSAAQ